MITQEEGYPAMAFTQDELQAFHTILDQRLSVHRRELERSLDQRVNVVRREFEQRLVAAQQEMARTLTHQLSEQQTRLRNSLRSTFESQQSRSMQVLAQEAKQRQEQQQQHFESFVEDALAAQLLAMEQLLQQNLAPLSPNEHVYPSYSDEPQPNFETFEVQTEIPWEDLVEMVGKALDERLVTLNDATQNAIKLIEQQLSTRLLSIRDELIHAQLQPPSGTISNMQDVFTSIQQLERIIESMQVAMTANNALLSNRLLHHQQLPLERAHISNQSTEETMQPTKRGQFPLSQERLHEKGQ